MTDTQSSEQKTVLVIRSQLSVDGYVSIYFSSSDGRLLNEREWRNLKQVVEVASQVSVKPEAMLKQHDREYARAHNESINEGLRKLERRRQNYLSIAQDPSRKRFEREMAQGDLELMETKIAELRKRMSTENDEPLFDIGGES
ncbi:MAG: hypothetical protein WAR24_19580 [Candidatus Acidiferrales bacterium]